MKSKVAVLNATPETVLADYGRLLRLAGYGEALDREKTTIINITNHWDVWYPAASTAPWQLEGVIRELLAGGFRKETLVVTGGRTASDSGAGELNNGQLAAAGRLGLGITHLYKPPVKWVNYLPRAPMLALGSFIAEEGFYVPDFFIGANVIHLPTLKTHLQTVVAGAAESAFQDLAPRRIRLTGHALDEAMVDILAIQKEIHAGIFAVLDGVFCGDGPGPRILVPYEKGYILAGADQVAIDAVAAHMMGFDPMKIGYIRLAHERGLGCGHYDDIEVAGDDISGVNFHFSGHGSAGPGFTDSAGRRILLANGSGLLSRLALESYWYPFIGRHRVYALAETKWGQLIQSYLPPEAALEKQGRSRGSLLIALAAAGLLGLSAFFRVTRTARNV